jgi:mono/diheme cytochrome c family protein
VAAGEPPDLAAEAAYGLHCLSCHGPLEHGDDPPAFMRPTTVHSVGARLSPGFVDTLFAGLGAMPPLEPRQGLEAELRPYLESVAGPAPTASTAIPEGGDAAAAATAFGELCESCHRDRGLQEAVMPTLAIRPARLSWTYVGQFVDAPFGAMPLVRIAAVEREHLRQYWEARRLGLPAPADASQTYSRRCAGCHPASADSPPIRVPHLVPVARRLSARLVQEISLAGGGAMGVAYRASGAEPSAEDVAAVYPHLHWLSSQTGRSVSVDPPDPDALLRGRAVYQTQCRGPECHDPSVGYDLGAHVQRGRPWVPLQHLSREMLRRVSREGLGEMAAVPADLVTEAQMDDVVEYLVHLGLGLAP